MIKKFIKGHISKFLNLWQQELELKKEQANPIDSMLRNYLKENKALGSNDRKLFTDNVYKLVRHKVYLDTISPKPLSWEGRLDTIYTEKFATQRKNTSILPHVRASCPKELFDVLCDSFGEEKAIEICMAQNLRAPLTVRVNPIKISREELIQKWRDANKFAIKPTEFSPYGITFTTDKNENLYELPEFKRGYFEIQDEASQLAAFKVKCQIGDHVLDYCAGAGGKSLAFAPYLRGTGQIYLHDTRDYILLEAKKRFNKAGIQNVQFQTQESLNNNKNKLLKKFDWVVCDVPCTGTGTLRRNPDLKYKFSRNRLKYFVDLQASVFKEALPFVKPKTGKIVYSTCSLLQEENIFQITKFCKEFNLEIVDGKHFQTIPSKDVEMDGFFCAVLQFKN
ncbi:hypothetical protein ABPG72_008041 [Tetrahymena utriculariae]